MSQKNAQIARLQAERDRLQHAAVAAQGEISGLKAKLGQAESEKATLLRDLDKLTLERDEQRIANKKLQEQLSKQKTTIKVQSDQIAQRASAGKSSTTPRRGSATPGPFSNIYDQPPPAYNAPPQKTIPLLPSSSPPPATPVTCRRSTPGPTSITPKRDSSRGPSRGPPGPKSPLELSPSDRQLAPIQEAEPSIELSAEFAKVFRLTEGWAHNYTNVPDPEDVLPAHLQSSLVQFTNPATALKLVSSGSTRYLAIAKLMNYQITTLMYRPLIAKGYTEHYDQKISEMRADFYKIVPIHVRRALMTAVADMFRDMTSEKPFEDHVERLIAHRVYETWSFLEPLFGPGVSRNEAWNDLSEIWQEAARVGILLLLKPSSFNVDYPLTGSSSLFNPAQMISRDVNFKQDPQTLSKMGVTIRLAITPVITETNYMSNEPTPRTLHFSNVLLEP